MIQRLIPGDAALVAPEQEAGGNQASAAEEAAELAAEATRRAESRRLLPADLEEIAELAARARRRAPGSSWVADAQAARGHRPLGATAPAIRRGTFATRTRRAGFRASCSATPPTPTGASPSPPTACSRSRRRSGRRRRPRRASRAAPVVAHTTGVSTSRAARSSSRRARTSASCSSPRPRARCETEAQNRVLGELRGDETRSRRASDRGPADDRRAGGRGRLGRLHPALDDRQRRQRAPERPAQEGDGRVRPGAGRVRGLEAGGGARQRRSVPTTRRSRASSRPSSSRASSSPPRPRRGSTRRPRHRRPRRRTRRSQGRAHRAEARTGVPRRRGRAHPGDQGRAGAQDGRRRRGHRAEVAKTRKRGSTGSWPSATSSPPRSPGSSTRPHHRVARGQDRRSPLQRHLVLPLRQGDRVVPADMDFQDYYLAEVKAGRIRYYEGSSSRRVRARAAPVGRWSATSSDGRHGGPVDSLAHPSRAEELRTFLAGGAKSPSATRTSRRAASRPATSAIVEGPDGRAAAADAISTTPRSRAWWRSLGSCGAARAPTATSPTRRPAPALRRSGPRRLRAARWHAAAALDCGLGRLRSPAAGRPPAARALGAARSGGALARRFARSERPRVAERAHVAASGADSAAPAPGRRGRRGSERLNAARSSLREDRRARHPSRLVVSPIRMAAARATRRAST